MPGSIQVSVLGLMDLPASLTSLVSVKVAIGRREFQTRDKGDFSFQLVNLRDILVVALCDAEGNEISRIDIQTKTVVEKGLWDDLFPFKGGGVVHMKLLFSLTEEERKRIRDMRESILRKKQVELRNRSLASSETPKDSILEPNEDDQSYHSETTTPMEDLNKNFSEAKGLSTGEMSQIAPTVRSSQSTADAQLECFKPSLTVNTHKEGSLALTSGGDGNSSNNVRKMISAFESTLSQAEVLAARASVEKAEIESKSQGWRKQTYTAGLLGEKLDMPNWNRPTNMQKAERAQHSFYTSARATRETESNLKKEKVLTEGSRCSSLQQSTAYETSDATVPSQKNEPLLSEDIQFRVTNEGAIRYKKHKHSEDTEEDEVLNRAPVELSGANKLSISCRVIEGKDKAHVQDKVKGNVCASSNQKQERQALEEMEYGTIECLDGCLFYADSRHLCITTAGKRARDFFDVYHMESETHRSVSEFSAKENEIADDIITQVTKGCNASHDSWQQEHGNSDDPTKDVGLFEQVLKITVILVCGTLFLCTAQRKNRR